MTNAAQELIAQLCRQMVADGVAGNPLAPRPNLIIQDPATGVLALTPARWTVVLARNVAVAGADYDLPNPSTQDVRIGDRFDVVTYDIAPTSGDLVMNGTGGFLIAENTNLASATFSAGAGNVGRISVVWSGTVWVVVAADANVTAFLLASITDRQLAANEFVAGRDVDNAAPTLGDLAKLQVINLTGLAGTFVPTLPVLALANDGQVAVYAAFGAAAVTEFVVITAGVGTTIETGATLNLKSGMLRLRFVGATLNWQVF